MTDAIQIISTIAEKLTELTEDVRSGRLDITQEDMASIAGNETLITGLEDLVIALLPIGSTRRPTAHSVGNAVVYAVEYALTTIANQISWPPAHEGVGDVWADRLGREWTVIAQDGMTLLERDETETPDPRDSVVCEPDWVERTYGPMTFLRGAGRDTATDESLGGS